MPPDPSTDDGHPTETVRERALERFMDTLNGCALTGEQRQNLIAAAERYADAAVVEAADQQLGTVLLEYAHNYAARQDEGPTPGRWRIGGCAAGRSCICPTWRR